MKDTTGTQPSGDASQRSEMTAREKILATASDLFYREGIRAIGVDTIVEKSGVAKTSLYRWFPSKDALVAAFLEDQDRQLWQWWDKVLLRHPGEPREQLRAVLAGIAKRIARPDFRGCPFVNTSVEFADKDHPGRVVARANRKEMRRRLCNLVGEAGAREPERLTDQIILLINGAYAGAQLLPEHDTQHDFIAATETLLTAGIGGGHRKAAGPPSRRDGSPRGS